jgi:preprotein translocase subunit SecB
MSINQPNGSPPPAGPAPNGTDAQVRILGQFIRDFSFENPSANRIPLEQGEQPALRVEVNVNAQPAGTNLYESVIELKAHCSAKAGVLYDLEILYASVLQITNVPQEALEPFLMINVPSLAFPFVRRLVADITREGGFPPLLLDPIDFSAIYAQRRQQAEQATTAAN